MAQFTHAVLTRGKPVDVLPLNVAGEKAVLRFKIELAKQGEAAPELAKLADSLHGLEMLELVAFHTLARVVDGLTQAEVSRHLDGPAALLLGALIRDANADDAAPKALSPQALDA